MSKNLDCEIVRDLLPLYVDKVVSDTTSQAVEAHLAGCDTCSDEYAALSREVAVEVDNASARKKFTETMKKSKIKRKALSAVLIALCAVILIGGMYVLFCVPLIKADPRDFEVVGIYQGVDFDITGGEQDSHYAIVLKAKRRTGGYAVCHMGGGGSTIIELKRPILSIKYKEDSIHIENIFNMTKYYDSVKLNDKVIWEKSDGTEMIVKSDFATYVRFSPSDRFVDIYNGYMGVRFCDDFDADLEDKLMIWDLNGKLVYEGYPDSDGMYPDCPYNIAEAAVIPDDYYTRGYRIR